jgi:hypothetical protein
MLQMMVAIHYSYIVRLECRSVDTKKFVSASTAAGPLNMDIGAASSFPAASGLSRIDALSTGERDDHGIAEDKEHSA